MEPEHVADPVSGSGGDPIVFVLPMETHRFTKRVKMERIGDL